MKKYLLQLLILTIFLWPSCRHYTERKSSPHALKIVTQNVLGWGYDIHKRSYRIASLLYATNADIIALQEVKPPLLKALLSQKWVRAEYNAMVFPAKTRPHIGLYILSRYPIFEMSYKKIPGKRKIRALFATIRINGHNVRVANIHLESPLHENRLRANQLQEIFRYMKNYKYAIVTGDFNFGDAGESENSFLDSSYTDLWLTLHPASKGYTWDMKKNYLAAKNAFNGEQSRRLDRILFKKDGWSPVQIRMINEDWPRSFRQLYPVSDHYGLYGELKMLY